MAHNRQYTPQKRLVMQVVMWLILGATVALAAAVSSYRKNALQIKLSDPLSHGGVTVALPRDWKITKLSPADHPTLLRAVDPADDGHQIRITRENLPIDSFPLTYLNDRLSNRDVKVDGLLQKLQIAGNPGLLIRAEGRMQIDMEEILRTGQFMGPPTHYFAATVDPSGRGFMIEYQAPGPYDRADEQLLVRIAESVALDVPPSHEQTGEIALSPAVSLSPPSGFTEMPEDDPQTTRRRWRSTQGNALRMISAVPIVLGEKESIETIRTMLSLCKPLLVESKIDPLEKNLWRIDTRISELNNFHPIRGYATVNQSGYGMIVILEGGEDQQWIDDAWETLRTSMRFRDVESVSRLVDHGAEQARRLTDAGLAQLLGEARPEQWWLICLKDVSRPMGWIHQEHKDGAWSCSAETRIRLPERGVHRNYFSWQSAADLRKYQMSCDYSLGEDIPSPGYEMIVKSTARLAQGQVTITCRTRDGEGSDVTLPAPANYLPGGWLASLIGHFDDDQALIRTDSLLGYGYANPSAMLEVIVRTERTDRKSAEGDLPLKCRTVEVVGSGEIERWYYRPDGTLELTESSDGFLCLPRDATDIQMDFAREPAMKP